MIIDGSENKIPAYVFKEYSTEKQETCIEKKETCAEKKESGVTNMFDAAKNLPKEVFKSVILTFIVEYADANGVSEKELISDISDIVNGPVWDFEKLLVKAVVANARELKGVK